MCLFTHFAAGALVGGATGNVWAAAVAGLTSHAVLDAIPHYDHPDWRVELGGGLASLVLLLLLPFASWPAVIGGLAGMLPDLENLLHKLGKLERRQFIFPSHTGLVPHTKRSSGGWARPWVREDGVGRVQESSVSMSPETSPAISSKASRKISMLIDIGSEPVNSGGVADSAPRVGGRFQRADLLTLYSVGL